MFSLLCLQLLLPTYCCDVDNIDYKNVLRLFLSPQILLHDRVLSIVGEKRSVFCFIYSFNILFLEKYILPGHFLLLQTCPNRHWKTKIINAIWVFWGVVPAAVLHWTSWKLCHFRLYLSLIKIKISLTLNIGFKWENFEKLKELEMTLSRLKSLETSAWKL